MIYTKKYNLEVTPKFILLSDQQSKSVYRVSISDICRISNDHDVFTLVTTAQSFEIAYSPYQRPVFSLLQNLWNPDEPTLSPTGLTHLEQLVKEAQKTEARETFWLGTGKGVWTGCSFLIVLSIIGAMVSSNYESLLSKAILFTGMMFFWVYLSSLVISWLLKNVLKKHTLKTLTITSLLSGLLLSSLIWSLPEVEPSSRSEFSLTPFPSFEETLKDMEDELEPTYGLNESFKVGYTRYTVTQIQWKRRLGSSYYGKEADSRYLLISVKVKNEDKKNRTIPPFHLKDTSGNEYDESVDRTYLGDQAFFLSDLNPGVEKKGVLVFDVPPENHYLLKVSGGYWSDEKAKVTLN